MSRTGRAVQNDYSSESAAKMTIDIDKAIQVSRDNLVKGLICSSKALELYPGGHS